MPWPWMGPHSRIFLGRFHREHTSLLCEIFASLGTVTAASIHHPEQWEQGEVWDGREVVCWLVLVGYLAQLRFTWEESLKQELPK